MKDFENVLELVKKGFPVYKALKKLNINSFNFYKGIDTDKKRILKEIAISSKKKSLRTGACRENYNRHTINGFVEF
jgi:hypothetical protein